MFGVRTAARAAGEMQVFVHVTRRVEEEGILVIDSADDIHIYRARRNDEDVTVFECDIRDLVQRGAVRLEIEDDSAAGAKLAELRDDVLLVGACGDAGS